MSSCACSGRKRPVVYSLAPLMEHLAGAILCTILITPMVHGIARSLEVVDKSWDLNHMCLADTRKGQHKKAINDLLMVQDDLLLLSLAGL
eukprot:4392677-Amphidinium_carterae.1